MKEYQPKHLITSPRIRKQEKKVKPKQVPSPVQQANKRFGFISEMENGCGAGSGHPLAFLFQKK